MLGHAPEPDFGAADFWLGVGAVLVVLGVVDDVDEELTDGDVLVAAVVEAAALDMPAATPPVASAPATMVAPSILEIVIRSNLLGRLGMCRPSWALALSGCSGMPGGSVRTDRRPRNEAGMLTTCKKHAIVLL
jgi:hypothetical protein